MTHTQLQQTKTTNLLKYADRVIIASVITWDSCNESFIPDEIEAIRIEEDMVWVRLTDNRSYPISRFMFRSILEAQRTAINKQVDEIIRIEEAEVLEAERQMSEIIHAAAVEEFELTLSSEYDWLTEPIGANPDYIFGLPAEAQAEVLPPAENSYHDLRWTTEGCEF